MGGSIEPSPMVFEDEGTQVLPYQEEGDLSFPSGEAGQPSVIRVNNNQSCIKEKQLGHSSKKD